VEIMSELWATWVGDLDPAEFLRRADQAVSAGKFSSRQDAFVDFAKRAIRLRQPDIPDDCTPESLARDLQDYAEGSESVSP
jgi:hypothetical protein